MASHEDPGPSLSKLSRAAGEQVEVSGLLADSVRIVTQRVRIVTLNVRIVTQNVRIVTQDVRIVTASVRIVSGESGSLESVSAKLKRM